MTFELTRVFLLTFLLQESSNRQDRVSDTWLQLLGCKTHVFPSEMFPVALKKMLDLPKFCWGMKSLGHADTPSYDKASLWTGILFLRTLLRRLNCVCALANSLGTLFPVSLPALLTRNRKSDALLSCLYFFWLCARLQFKIHLYRFNSVRLKFLWCIDLVVGLYSSLVSFQT